MSEDTSMPWKGAVQIKHPRRTSRYCFFLTFCLVISKKAALFAQEGVLWIMNYPHPPENAAVLPRMSALSEICLTACLGATANWKEFSWNWNFLGSAEGHLSSRWSPWLHVTASKRFLPRATFLPITTPPRAFQASLMCINPLNFYGVWRALSVNRLLHPTGFGEGLGHGSKCACTQQSQDRLWTLRG